MKQPFLGKKIAEARNQQAITQKELADLCQIDIRTIQRIESGEVIPRGSTLRLIAQTLRLDPQEILAETDEAAAQENPVPLYSAATVRGHLIIGILYLLSWIVYSPLLPITTLSLNWRFALSILFLLTGFLFYFGFFDYARRSRNGILKFASVIILITTPLSFILNLFTDSFGPANLLQQLLIALMGLNGILFGIGLFRASFTYRNVKLMAGAMQLLSAPFFIIPLPITHYIGCWLSLLFILLLLLLSYGERPS